MEQADVGPLEIANPAEAADRSQLIQALAAAEEIGTAIPSVAYYASEGPGSLHRHWQPASWGTSSSPAG